MNLISQILHKKRQSSSCALIPFLTAGYPNINITIDLLFALDKRGADIIELGIPYTDALADGYLIQSAAKVALGNRVYIDQILDILYSVKNKIKAPIVIFTYYNPILVRGLSRFIQEITEAGAKGLVIPDLPIEETDYILSLCTKYELELILFISPTSSKYRVRNILNKAQGPIYLVSSTGVTGIRELIGDSIYSVSQYINSQSNKFVILGFGISTPLQISRLLSSKINIDAIVIGSAFTNIIFNNFHKKEIDIVKEVGDFCTKIKFSMNI